MIYLRRASMAPFRRAMDILLLLLLWPISLLADGPVSEISNAKMHAILTGNVTRPLRYWPVNGDFVITNGTEFFNRPLYCEDSAFRIDCGDKPEFSIYAPGHGGNFRPGIQTAAGTKWLNDADEIVARYRAGSMIYEIRDSLLTGSGEVKMTVLPLAGARGFVVRAELERCPTPVRLIWAFGGANGLRGKRGGDIGCESEPVSDFFQLHPADCKGNEFLVQPNRFLLRSRLGAVLGIFPAGSMPRIADSREWNSAGNLLAPVGTVTEFAVAVGSMDLPEGQGIYFALGETNAFTSGDLLELFSKAEKRRAQIAGQVTVETPDKFINAAVPALNVAANAIWDGRQGAFMHGAVAWRERLAGWRGPYAGDALGWHERTATHFAGFAHQQNTNPIPDRIPPADESANLARNEAALHSNGDLTKSHYDMNLVAVDAFFRHLLWTGDTNYARELWPVIQRHLAWERRLFRREFGPDHLPLYEGYADIWASDNLSYDGGGAAHASAYNYFENLMAARLARILGDDPKPYEREAQLILRGMNKYLWLSDEGCFAEYKDYLGLQLTHPDPALWTFYTTIDSGAPTPSQAWQMALWLDSHLPRIPVRGANVPDEGLFTLPTSNWMPYEWSLNNVVMAEAAHASLGYWEAGRPDTAFRLFKGELLLSMYCGLCPGNLGAMTSLDAARGEAQRDFGDAIGINARALIEGLFGVRADALAGTLTIDPGFPANWNFASLYHPDLSFEFRRTNNSETFLIVPKFKKAMRLVLDIPVVESLSGTEIGFRGPVGVLERHVAGVTVNGTAKPWKLTGGAFGPPRIELDEPPEQKWDVRVTWAGGDLQDEDMMYNGRRRSKEAHFAFDWNTQLGAYGKFETIGLSQYFNDKVGQIFKNEYRSPRSPFCSLAIPTQGIGGWCEPNQSFEVDDSGLRQVAAESGGKIVLPDGVPFETPASMDAKNVVFTSQWRNYPDEVSVPLTGNARWAFLLMAGTTDPMQSGVENGEVIVTYKDGTTTKLPLENPSNWWPIDQDYFTDDFAFRLDAPSLPPRVDLRTGRVRVLQADKFKGRGGTVPGGAATVLQLPLDPEKELKSISVRAVANEVVVGLMAVTLQRE